MRLPPLINFFLLLLFSPCRGESGPAAVRVTVDYPSQAFRTGAPALVPISINNLSGRILDGALETSIGGEKPVFTHEMSNLTLVPGVNRRTLTLPYVGLEAGATSMSFRFRDAAGRIDAGSRSFTDPSISRTHLLRMCFDRELGPAEHRIAQLLRLERVAPMGGARTAIEWISPEQLPQEPLLLMSCDVLILGGRALSTAKTKALDSIARWVDAGGSVMVILPSDFTTSEAVEKFLRRLQSEDLPVVIKGDTPVRTVLGLGRVVIWKGGGYAAEGDEEHWTQVASWLWKSWTPEERKRLGNEFLSRRSGWGDTSLVERLRFELQRALMEKVNLTVRPMEFGTVGMGFFLFVVFIAPLDFFILRRRHRKFTWIVFPMLCVAFAWACMTAANRGIGRVERAASVVFVDLGIDGRPLRETRITCILPGETGRAEFTGDGLVQNLLRGEFTRFPSEGIDFHKSISGGRASASTQRRQWTPCFFRGTHFGEVQVPQNLEWFTPDDRNDQWRPIRSFGVSTDATPFGGLPMFQLSPDGGHGLADLIIHPGSIRRGVKVSVQIEGPVIRVYRQLYKLPDHD